MATETITEVWRAVVGYEGFYSVSNLGRIRNDRNGHILQWTPGSKTAIYPCVRLSANGNRKTRTIHTLVAEAFIGPRAAPQIQVNHIDGNKLNPCAANLEYLTRSDNQLHACHVLGIGIGETNSRAVLSEAAVREIRRLADSVMHTSLAKRFGVSKSTITDIYKRRSWKHIA